MADTSPTDKRSDEALTLVDGISEEASAIRNDWTDPRGELRQIQEYCDKLRALLAAPSESETQLLRRACDAAFAFIDSHVADPDITDEMCIKHATYKDARAALEGK